MVGEAAPTWQSCALGLARASREVSCGSLSACRLSIVRDSIHRHRPGASPNPGCPCIPIGRDSGVASLRPREGLVLIRSGVLDYGTRCSKICDGRRYDSSRGVQSDLSLSQVSTSTSKSLEYCQLFYVEISGQNGESDLRQPFYRNDGRVVMA